MTEQTRELGPRPLTDEGLLFSYLDEHLNANGATPHVAGLDAHGTPFVAWLNEEGGDCVYLTVSRLVENNGGTSSRTCEETPAQGQDSSLVYPVVVLERADRPEGGDDD